MTRHRVLADLAGSHELAVMYGGGPRLALSYLDFDRADSKATRETTEALIDKEEEGLRELKRLHHELRDVKDTSL
jgi:hypothetical protein